MTDNSTFTGWDTIGITGIGIIDEDRIRFQFTGRDNEVKQIFLPISSLGIFFESLLPLLKKAREKGVLKSDIGSDIGEKALTNVTDVAIGSDEHGTEFVLQFVTADGLSLQFRLDASTAQSMAEMLVSSLSKHDIDLDASPSQESRH